MDKKAALDALHARCFEARVPMSKVCSDAGVAQSTASRWRRDPATMTARTLGKLEAALARIERGEDDG